ncbi:hypothetical protein B5F07_09045 [Lachnoclostridium sp. An169]|nr:hypothetical protein B5F07_09045 [Lachnoclostridium sp. An169]
MLFRALAKMCKNGTEIFNSEQKTGDYLFIVDRKKAADCMKKMSAPGKNSSRQSTEKTRKK